MPKRIDVNNSCDTIGCELPARHRLHIDFDSMGAVQGVLDTNVYYCDDCRSKFTETRSEEMINDHWPSIQKALEESDQTTPIKSSAKTRFTITHGYAH